MVSSPSQLTIVQSRRCGAFVPPGGRNPSVLGSLFEALTGQRLPAPLASVAEAWARLARDGAHGPDVLADVLLVLVSTVPSADNDVNKQVLYARDDQGAVIARQLVAISDDDRLVPFAVYPQSAPQLVQLAFEEYDTDLATALGIPRLDPATPYDVANVLSHVWWDDGAWDPGAR